MCGAQLKRGQIVAAGSFECPNCQTKLQASNRYGRWIALCSLLFSVFTSLTLGYRGLHLLYAVLLVLVVIDFLALNLVKYALPPKIEIAVPPAPLSQLVRGLKAPTELNLRDKQRP
jgi:hypothetical protein